MGNHQGFGSKSTAEEVARDIRLDGKNVIVTGSNCGIGKETARVLAKMGANVYIACRDESKGNAALEELKNLTKSENIFFMQLDLSSLESVRKFATSFEEKNIPLHILINNAGVMACPQSKTVDGFEMQIGVNHFGHFLLSTLLLPSLKRGTPSRVVNVSSMGHKLGTIDFDDINYEKKAYGRWYAYGQSKLANILFAREFNKRYSAEGIKAFSLHPGAIITELQRHMPGFVNTTYRFVGPLFSKTIPQGAATTILVATGPEVEDKGGLYFSDCNVYNTTHNQVNDEVALKLWELSEKAVSSKESTEKAVSLKESTDQVEN